MPSGRMPTYAYRPAVGGTEPRLESRSMRRARLWAGGTYFRAREPGLPGNNISITLLEWTEKWVDEQQQPQEKLHGWLIVTNNNVKFDENVEGPVNVELLEHKLKWNEKYKIETITTNTTHARAIYSISVQIARRWEEQETFSGNLIFSQLFHIPDQLSVKLSPKQPEFTPGVTIIIKPRTRVYELKQKTVTSGPIFGSGPGTAATGWDPEALRQEVNSSDPWIEMPERAPAPTGGISLGRGYDVQDDGYDADFLTPFDEAYLAGGDGLPAFPSGVRTGPTRSLVHINYGERHNGSMAEVNAVYEWAGESQASGHWQRY